MGPLQCPTRGRWWRVVPRVSERKGRRNGRREHAEWLEGVTGMQLLRAMVSPHIRARDRVRLGWMFGAHVLPVWCAWE